VRRKDGTVIITELSTRKLDDGRIVTIARDVTDRKRAEDALRESEKRLAAAQKMAHLGSWEWDLVSDEAFGSAEMLHLLGLQPLGGENRFTIQSFIECLQPEDREWVQQALAKAVAERGSINYENRIVSPDGTVRIIHGLGEVVLDEAGQPVKMIGTARDITDSKQAEEALRESESRLRSALDLAQLSCYEWDPQTDALQWDMGLREIWGVSADIAVDNWRVYTRMTERLCKRRAPGAVTRQEMDFTKPNFVLLGSKIKGRGGSLPWGRRFSKAMLRCIMLA
jgi:PAS domain S-box-containing protein